MTVALGYDQRVRDALPSGFGFLVPRSEGKRMLAATFVHNKFSFRAPPDRALLRCVLGGTRDEGVLELPSEVIIKIARDELREILGITAEPKFACVHKWRGAMAQYDVGHIDRIARIERLRQPLPGLLLAGNAFRGIGIPDCIRSGSEAAKQAMAGAGLRHPSGAASERSR